jgi:riboflavin kinase/FMN adenylyltransferase
MKIISLNGGHEVPLKKTCAAIGIFDGVHLGHRHLIGKMVTRARRLKLPPVVITFFPHPAHVLRPDLKLGYLTSLKDRFRYFKDLGVSACVVIPFSRSFAKIAPEKFIKDILVKELRVKAVYVGDDFRFGRDRSGNVALFEKLGPSCGYEVHAVPAVKQAGDAISSTRIRQLIAEGRLTRAARLLGREVGISGTVVSGSKRGKGLGFPTANIACEADILPPQGVYAVRVWLGKKQYPALANIGTRPTFEAQVSKPCLEVHILDFSRNIYGKYLEVQFLKKIRNEKKFSGPQNLIRQIEKDVTFARKYFKK